MLSFLLQDFIAYDPKLRVRKPVFKMPSYVCEIVCYEPGQTTATHQHPDQDEIWLVLEGRGEIQLGDEHHPVGPSNLIFIPSGVRHGLAAAPASRLVLLFIKTPGITAPPRGPAPAPASGTVSPTSGLDTQRVRKSIFKVSPYVCEIVCYEPGQVAATHHHPKQDEIWLILEGKGEIWVDEARLPVQRTSLVYIPAGVRHGLGATLDSRMVLLFIKTPGIVESAAMNPLDAMRLGGGPDPIPVGTQFLLEVTDVQAEARDVLQVELRAPDASELPAFEPGGHLALDLPGGLLRHYSIASDWRERDRYVVGVGRAANSRGGSAFIHQGLRRGMRLAASLPKNGFPLVADGRQYLFLAGGIGITPILAMIRWCQAHGRPWQLVYAVRSAQRAAFLETLQALEGGSIHLHADDREGRFFDPRPWLAGAPAGEQVYCCGPAPMMAAVQQAAGHRDPASVHFEYFAAPGEEARKPRAEHAFEIELRRSGRTLAVPAHRSVLDVLLDNEVPVVCSCREGTCRTCETAVLEGAIDHRDYCLTAQEQAAGNTMMVCVSRARDGRLVLDR